MECQAASSEDTVLEQVASTFPSVYWRWEIGANDNIAESVEAELSRRLPHIEPSSWQARFELGGVYLYGRVASLGQKMSPPCRLEYYEPKVPIEAVEQCYPVLSAESIMYRDPDFAVVLKPAGLPTTPPRDQTRYHLQGHLEAMLSQAVHLPSRLDTGVAGLLLASLSARMNRHLQRAYDARRIEKYYLCEVAGWPTWHERVCEVAIERDPRHPVLRRCTSDSGMGVPAVTRFRCLAKYETDGQRRALLQAEPVTGRTHQIRLHCRWEGVPIVGDPYYSQAPAGIELRLVSYALRFFHPYQARAMTWEIPGQSIPEWLKNAGGHEIHYRSPPGMRHTG